MKGYSARAEKIMSRIEELASVSETEQGLTRTFGSGAWREAALIIQSWMQDAGLHAWIDNIGNVRGLLSSPSPGARTLVIASHMDTVINAGKFDGPLGVMMGLDLLEQLAHNHTPLPFNIQLVAFSDEEGCRFHTTYLGSKVLAGSFEPVLLEKKDADGIPLRNVIHANGSSTGLLHTDAIDAAAWLGYFEMHIEQGPVLYDRDIPVGIVKAIAGQKKAAITFEGIAGHAGTVPMDMRNDALCCAAEFILAVESIALQYKSQIVATVGKLEIANAASNVIPGAITCTLDLRSADGGILSEVYDTLQRTTAAICGRRNINFDWTVVQETSPVTCDLSLSALLSGAVKEAGYEPLELVSGAGHDAVAIAAVAPVCMLFVRCYKGISHNPLENVELKDIAAALQVADNFLQQMIYQHNQS
ncbi:allantoate amidohydrolase [uncultured Chitinophaga sp.]|jgi:amidase, hydantoinase/carbamoylase family|uniref:allantoate amidohydrolase n=1 Tax=uncultured Chitinophaga sp. TaxID=339340 RepID=UPI002609AEFD|nr:allantoate amidohydrolase [uncultured Chitinophaga sp.]